MVWPIMGERRTQGAMLACIIHEGFSGSRCVVKTGS